VTVFLEQRPHSVLGNQAVSMSKKCFDDEQRETFRRSPGEAVKGSVRVEALLEAFFRSH
jgi:hypothetical protein